jgi:hypothetical protein
LASEIVTEVRVTISPSRGVEGADHSHIIVQQKKGNCPDEPLFKPKPTLCQDGVELKLTAISHFEGRYVRKAVQGVACE